MDGRRSARLTGLWGGRPRIQRCEPRSLPQSWAWAVALAWPLLFVTVVAISPEPADPDAVPSLFDSLVFISFVVGLVGTTAAAFTRHASALTWSIGLGALWVGTAIACPVSGHHDAVDWQWRLELGLAAALLLLCVVGWRRLRTR
jgi:hypothetical protein